VVSFWGKQRQLYDQSRSAIESESADASYFKYQGKQLKATGSSKSAMTTSCTSVSGWERGSHQAFPRTCNRKKDTFCVREMEWEVTNEPCFPEVQMRRQAVEVRWTPSCRHQKVRSSSYSLCGVVCNPRISWIRGVVQQCFFALDFVSG
jgi:hypothetical protein